MTVLRRRMIGDLQLRNYARRTIETYVRNVARFALYYQRSPALLGPEDVRRYLIHLVEDRGFVDSTIRSVTAALRFLYSVTLGREEVVPRIKGRRYDRPAPVVLCRQEVARLLDAAPGLRERAMMETLYATGMRASELTHLRVEDIDGERPAIRIRRGKGHKGRYVPLFPGLRATLRTYYKKFRPVEWLFFPTSGERDQVIDRRHVAYVCVRAGRMAGLEKSVSPHGLRRAFATHLFEAKVDVFVIQQLMGHAQASTTRLYMRLTDKSLGATRTELDLFSSLDLGKDS